MKSQLGMYDVFHMFCKLVVRLYGAKKKKEVMGCCSPQATSLFTTLFDDTSHVVVPIIGIKAAQGKEKYYYFFSSHSILFPYFTGRNDMPIRRL